MALPTTTNDVTTRRLGTAISSLWTKIKNTFQTIGNKVTSWSSTPSDTKYPSEKLVKTALDGKVPGTTLAVSVPASSTRYVKMTVPSAYHHYLVFFNASMGVLHAEWLFRTYGSGGNSCTVVNYIGAPVTERKWYVAGADGLDFYIEFVNDSTSAQSLSFKVCALDISTLPTLSVVNTLPSGYSAMTIYGTVAEKLRVARNLAVDLSNTTTNTSFNGTANVTNIKTTGVLGVANGGTGNSSVDTEPTENSTKMVTSGGIKTALDGKEDTSNKVTAWSATTTDTHYPSETLVKTDLDNRLDRFDAVYNRNNTAGGGWVKLADTKPYTSIKQVDKPAIWDVMITRCTGETSSEQLCLNVRYELTGLPSIYFKRFYTINRTTTHKFAVVVAGVGGGTASEGKVELWAFLEKHWGSIAIREVAGSQSTNLYGMNKIQYNYYSYTMEGGGDKPTEDLENHIQVVDSTNVKLTAEDKANKSEGVYYVVGSSEYTAYSASSTYTATTSSGPFTSANSCTYGGIAYFCKTTISTPEAWTSAHWTAMGTPVLTGNIDGLTALYAGLKIAYKMSIRGGTSSTYLNINNLGNKYIRRNDSNLTTHLPANTVVFLAYDGTYWRWADYDYAPNNWVTTMGAYCDTAAATQAKTAISTNTVYTASEAFLIRIVNANTYNGKITLNINSQGAKDVWINGAVSSSSNKTLPAGEHWCYYDGNVFHIWTDGTAQFTKLKATSYKGLEYTNGENLVYQYVSGGSSNCTYPADHSYVTIAPDNRDTYFGIKFAEDVAADEIISAAFDVEYTGDDDGQFKWEFKAIGQQGGIKITITGAGHYTAYGVAGLAVSKGTLQNAAFDDLGRTLPANSLKIKNFKFERGATATGFCLCKDETSIGHAETADKINTSVKIGDTNQPVYVAADGTVTPISYTIATSVPANAVFTDTKVKATAKTDNVNYKILATASASPTSGNATEAVYDTDITLNPSTNTIAASISGNAATATSAGKLTTARKTYVTLGTASKTTTRDWSGDTTIPVDGTLGVGNGGTGKSSVTSNSFLVGNGSSAMVEKTPAQVLSLIGAQATITYMTTDQENSIITELGDL